MSAEVTQFGVAPETPGYASAIKSYIQKVKSKRLVTD